MTDTNAPERIWANSFWADTLGKQSKTHPRPLEYIRADLATPAPREDGYSAGVRAALHGILEDSNLARLLDGRLCCDGHECGCQGASVRSYLEWLAKEAPALPDARAGAVEPVAWRVKPLEWKPGMSELVIARADLPLSPTSRYTVWSDFSLHGCLDGPRPPYPDAEAAKAAAQADCEARVRSALHPTPACTATDGPASACVYRAPGLGTAADWERG